jgi:hypothetical protein
VTTERLKFLKDYERIREIYPSYTITVPPRSHLLERRRKKLGQQANSLKLSSLPTELGYAGSWSDPAPVPPGHPGRRIDGTSDFDSVGANWWLKWQADAGGQNGPGLSLEEALATSGKLEEYQQANERAERIRQYERAQNWELLHNLFPHYYPTNEGWGLDVLAANGLPAPLGGTVGSNEDIPEAMARLQDIGGGSVDVGEMQDCSES